MSTNQEMLDYLQAIPSLADYDFKTYTPKEIKNLYALQLELNNILLEPYRAAIASNSTRDQVSLKELILSKQITTIE